jgi:S1-C subfamily serine protease
MIRKIVIILTLMLLSFTGALAEGRIETSMVKIYTIKDNPSYINPWDTGGPESVSGSGAVISDNRIITNAHVVSNNTFIQVRAYGKAKKYEAEVMALSHEADLALLRVKDSSFYQGIHPLEIGELPKTQQSIVVYGFPMGGDTLSTTKGVVSRIEHRRYVHSRVQLLAIQIDAAINPGNSGGPAISEHGKIVGISMQGIDNAENIGYLIPSVVVKHFLRDLEDDQYNGIPSLGILTQGMENPSHRKMKKMEPGMTGCLITKVLHGFSADGCLKEDDVLLKIGGYVVDNDQTIEFRPQDRTHFRYCIQHLQMGETVELEILRNGNRQAVKVPLKSRLGEDHLVKIEWDRPSTYYIYGGLVFNPLTINYLRAWGDTWYKEANVQLLSYLLHNWVEQKGQQIVILNKVLPAALNTGYHNFSNEVVISINNEPIDNMKELVRLMEAETQENEFVNIQLTSNKRIVLKKSDVANASGSILERYKIEKDRSEDLRPE